jgi:hypothetical protein
MGEMLDLEMREVNVKCGQQINAEKAEDSQPGQDKQAKYI